MYVRLRAQKMQCNSMFSLNEVIDSVLLFWFAACMLGLNNRYPWDVYLKVEYSREEINAFQATCQPDRDEPQYRRQAFALRLLQRELAHWKSDAVQIGDAGTVAALIAILRGEFTCTSCSRNNYEDPTLDVGLKEHNKAAVTMVTYPVAVELQGAYTRGMTVVDVRPFVTEPDVLPSPENASVGSHVLRFNICVTLCPGIVNDVCCS